MECDQGEQQQARAARGLDGEHERHVFRDVQVVERILWAGVCDFVVLQVCKLAGNGAKEEAEAYAERTR